MFEQGLPLLMHLTRAYGQASLSTAVEVLDRNMEDDMARMFLAILALLMPTPISAEKHEVLKNVADLQWLINNAREIGVKVTEKREYPRKESADWIQVWHEIDCDSWRWPEHMKPNSREVGLQLLWIHVLDPELVNFKGWMRRDRTINGQKVNASGQFVLGFHRSGVPILGDDVHVDIGKGPTYDERKADLDQFLMYLDVIVAGCAAGYRAELEQKK